MRKLDFQFHTMAAGFAHSCAINKRGQLHVWGDNGSQQLREAREDEDVAEFKTIEAPLATPLEVRA